MVIKFKMFLESNVFNQDEFTYLFQLALYTDVSIVEDFLEKKYGLFPSINLKELDLKLLQVEDDILRLLIENGLPPTKIALNILKDVEIQRILIDNNYADYVLKNVDFDKEIINDPDYYDKVSHLISAKDMGLF